MLLAENDHCGARWIELWRRLVSRLCGSEDQQGHIHVNQSRFPLSWYYEGLCSRFPVDRWLDTKEDDGRISLELEPNKKPASKKATGQYAP